MIFCKSVLIIGRNEKMIHLKLFKLNILTTYCKYLVILFFCMYQTSIANNNSLNINLNENLHNSIPLVNNIINNYNMQLKKFFYKNSDHLLQIKNKKVIKVIAAENFYGNVAKLIAGKYATVQNIITNTHSDPHLFTISARKAMFIQNSDIIIYNGANYDQWIDPFVTNKNNKTISINVSSLINIRNGENPHIWFKPETFIILAKKLTDIFSILLPEHEKIFQLNLRKFLHRYQSINFLVQSIKSQYQGTKVIATEPIFGYMSQALGFSMMGGELQWVMMNGAEPSPKMLINYQKLLINKNIQILFYNQQVQGNTLNTLIELAKEKKIPVIGVTEILPHNYDVITWLEKILKHTKKALEIAKCNSVVNYK